MKEISIYVTSIIPKLPKLGKLEPLVRSYPEEHTNRTGVININFRLHEKTVWMRAVPLVCIPCRN